MHNSNKGKANMADTSEKNMYLKYVFCNSFTSILYVKEEEKVKEAWGSFLSQKNNKRKFQIIIFYEHRYKNPNKSIAACMC